MESKCWCGERCVHLGRQHVAAVHFLIILIQLTSQNVSSQGHWDYQHVQNAYHSCTWNPCVIALNTLHMFVINVLLWSTLYVWSDWHARNVYHKTICMIYIDELRRIQMLMILTFCASWPSPRCCEELSVHLVQIWYAQNVHREHLDFTNCAATSAIQILLQSSICASLSDWHVHNVHHSNIWMVNMHTKYATATFWINVWKTLNWFNFEFLIFNFEFSIWNFGLLTALIWDFELGFEFWIWDFEFWMLNF